MHWPRRPGKTRKVVPIYTNGWSKYTVGSLYTEVSNNGGDGLLRETSLKKSRCFKLYRAYSISSNSPNASNFFFLTLNSNGLCQNSGKEKESRCLVCTSSKKREIRYFHVVVVQWRQRNVQKSVMHVQSCCVANLNQLIFLPFSLMSPFYCHGQPTEVSC